MRSLQRAFKEQYGVSMNEFQDHARLKRAIWYMKVTPNVKMSALASEMGYDCQGRSKTRPLGRSKNRPVELLRGMRGRRACGA